MIYVHYNQIRYNLDELDTNFDNWHLFIHFNRVFMQRK